ncbi:MAG: glycosyltransferase [Nanoarchaeota archaeon]|nr:glycosyltransferase [Nanoarchaeota archaeon]
MQIKESKPLISIVIPTRNEEKRIGKLLRSIKEQTYKNYEILVGDSSDDKTPNICKKEGAKVFRAKRRGVSAGRNIALKHARGELVAFIDADVILTRRVFEAAVKALENKRTVGVMPLFKPIAGEIPKNKRPIIYFLNDLGNFLIKANGLGGFRVYGCVICRRKDVNKVGYFDEKMHISEDTDFYRRLSKYGKFKALDVYAYYSYRRFIEKGIPRTFLFYIKNALITAAFKKNQNELERIR